VKKAGGVLRHLTLLGLAIFMYEIWGNTIKTCVYDHGGDEFYLSVDVNDSCPATIEVD
jgi:hypothetical protein